MELNTAISPPMDITSYKSISSVKTSRVSIQPENKTSLSLVGSNTSDLYFSLPSRPNSFLAGSESFLTFTYTFEGTTPTASSSVQICNGSPQSFLRNLETTAGATSLELVNEMNALGCLISLTTSRAIPEPRLWGVFWRTNPPLYTRKESTD